MKIAPLLLFSVLTLLARAEYPPRIAPADRIVTLEQWGGRGNEALVWAVRPAELVVYYIFSSTRNELLATVALTKEESEAIVKLVAKIGKSDRGKVWFDANVQDGSMLRISFSPDGDLRQDRVEVANHWRPEFQELITRVSAKAPEKWKIRFRERVAHLEQGHKADIKSLSVKEYYGEK